MKYYIYSSVNRALEGRVNRVALPYYDGGVHYMPTSLLAAIYIAFQDVIAGTGLTERECPNCGLRFTTKYRTKIYCSPNCAKRYSEAKRRQAGQKS